MSTRISLIRKDKQVTIAGPAMGSVICDVSKTSLRQELFAVIGRSYNEIALVRIFEKGEISDMIAGKWYQLCHKIKSVNQSSVLLWPLFADLSHIIVKDQTPLMSILNSEPERQAGLVHKQDLDQIVLLIGKVNTLSRDIKNKYFANN